MPWSDIKGHDAIIEQFRRSVARGRLASTFLFVGPSGIGKRAFAFKLAQALMCEFNPEEQFDPCGRCPACQQVAAGSHADVEYVAKPEDKSFIPVELFIGDRQHRRREGLCHRIALKPFRGGRKIAVIDDADWLNQEGANCLLKTLEEPPPQSVIILIGTSEQKQLPTIRSRCQTVRFRPLSVDIVAELLESLGWAGGGAEAQRWAESGSGSLERAFEFADPDYREFREALLETLSQSNWKTLPLSQEISSFVDRAGKEAPPRRARMLKVIEISVDFFGQLMRSLSGAPAFGEASFVKAVNQAKRAWPGDAETAAACVERCLEAHAQVESNANQATLIECWLDDLGWLSGVRRDPHFR